FNFTNNTQWHKIQLPFDCADAHNFYMFDFSVEIDSINRSFIFSMKNAPSQGAVVLHFGTIPMSYSFVY
ncbi:MAG: hypothetical protein II197_00435, partial [Peptococcaceae bacterium]|nr:hypothetical protein [Peptococcaceae bacterium]